MINVSLRMIVLTVTEKTMDSQSTSGKVILHTMTLPSNTDHKFIGTKLLALYSHSNNLNIH